MKQEYREAFAEVDSIFKLMPISLLNKIPTNFRNMINTEKATDYEPTISEPFEEQQMKEETIIILGLIYRDFLCSEEERKILKGKDAEKIKQAEEELRKKYNPDDIFKKKDISQEKEKNKEISLAIIPEKKWYKKIFNLIKVLFKGK